MDIENQNLDSQQVNPGENMGIKQEIGEILDEKQILLRMIGKIENEEVKSVLSSYVNKGRCPLVRMKDELKIYNDSLDNLSSESVSELNDIISKYDLLPSIGFSEMETKNEILLEEDPKVKELIEVSLKSGLKPSIIKEGKDIYGELAMAKDQEEKNLILYYLKEAYTPKLVFEEYESFGEIMRYEYKDENLKNFILSLIENEQVNPSFIELYFDLFKDKEFGEETENYMRGLLNQPKK